MPGHVWIFLLIIAIWAAYLVQSWSRHHQYAVAARSADRFATALTILDRRAQLTPEMEQFLDDAEQDSTDEDLDMHDVEPVRALPRWTQVRPFDAALAQVAALPRLSSPQIRAMLLLASLACTIAGTATVFTLGWSWAFPLVSAAVLLGTLTWGVLAQKAARRRRLQERAGRQGSRPASGATRVVERPAPRVAEAPSTGATPVARPAARPAAVARPAAPVVAENQQPAHPEKGALFDVASADPAPAPAAAAPAATKEPAPMPHDGLPPVAEPLPEITETEVAPQPRPGEWEPVPVPRPTYTMKGRAVRVEAPIEEIPFDGNAMALDVEDEELPSVFNVG